MLVKLHELAVPCILSLNNNSFNQNAFDIYYFFKKLKKTNYLFKLKSKEIILEKNTRVVTAICNTTINYYSGVF